MTTVKNIYDYINSIAPFDTQEEWDNSGHLVGDFRAEVKKVVLSLDATKEVVSYCADVNANLLLTHHPVIFSKLADVKSGSVVYELVKNNVACISAHTNFDKAECGINTNLAELLEIKNTEPYCGGFIRIGELDGEMSIDDFAGFVENKLNVSGIRYTECNNVIKKVAVGGGSCGEFMDYAINNADCFVTGDLKYHEMLSAYEQGKAVISAGHFETESFAFLMIKDKLEKIFTDVEFLVAPVSNPIKTAE